MFIFPVHRFCPDGIKADVVQRVISGGTALNDEEDVIATDGGGRWEITFTDLYLDHEDDSGSLERLYSGWTSHWAGGAQSFLAPIPSLDIAPKPIAGNSFATPSDLIVDDDDFPTEVRFASPYIIAAVVADTALRATSVTIVVSQGARLQTGQRFSIGTRAYKIERVTARDGMEATCKITPPLREAVTAGDAVNFDWPVVECRAVPAQDFAAEMAYGRLGSASVRFVEHVTYGS